jgi:uncharacterized protein (DUF885 family)
MRRAWLLIGLVATGCGPDRPRESFSQLASEFVYTSLSFSPVNATASGYHRHQQLKLDEMLDDLSPAGLDRQRQFYRTFRERLARSVKPEDLAPDDRADYDILTDQIALALLELDEIQSWRHNPTVYVELVGNALFQPHVLDYAPKKERLAHIIARLEKVPAFLAQARQNLAEAPEIWTTVAMEENEGNLNLVDRIIRAGLPDDARDGYDRAAGPALEALRGFQEYLKTDLAKRNAHDWGLGAEKYKKKFRYVLATDLAPEKVLENAEADLTAVRARMLELARSLGQPSVPAALARIARRHATTATYIADARRDLEEARRFVRAKSLLPLPPRDNLLVIETPEFMRGIYAVGGFMAAPALEPKLGAFYWVTPIPKEWPSSGSTISTSSSCSPSTKPCPATTSSSSTPTTSSRNPAGSCARFSATRRTSRVGASTPPRSCSTRVTSTTPPSFA